MIYHPMFTMIPKSHVLSVLSLEDEKNKVIHNKLSFIIMSTKYSGKLTLGLL